MATKKPKTVEAEDATQVEQFKANLRHVLRDPRQFAQLLAEMERLPKYVPPEPQPRQAPFRQPKLLRALCRDTEKVLEGFGLPPDAWRLINLHSSPKTRAWGWGSEAEDVLGKDTDSPRWAAARIAAALHFAAEMDAESRRNAGKAAAQARHADHVEENVEPYRSAYKDRLRAAKQQNRRESYQKLSAPIIRAMAENDGTREKRLRDMIGPRTVWKELEAEKPSDVRRR